VKRALGLVILFLLPTWSYAQGGVGPAPYRGVNNWNVIFGTDNTYDIGAVAASRPRTGYFGTSLFTPALTVSGLTATRCTFAGTGGLLSDDSDCTFSGTRLTVTDLTAGSVTDSGLTAGRVPFAHTAGLLSDSADREITLLSSLTATAGVDTAISLRAVADLSATDFVVLVEDANGTDLGWFDGTGTFQSLASIVIGGTSSTRLGLLNSSGYVTRSGSVIGFSSSATDSGGGADTAIARHSAGVMKATNGSTGIRYYLGGGANVASATALPLPTGNVFHVTGTATITSITSTNHLSGVEITLIFDGALTFTDGSNLKLAGDFVTTADDTINLVYDGTNWYETSRSVN
jgi:phage FluMu protein gp41